MSATHLKVEQHLFVESKTTFSDFFLRLDCVNDTFNLSTTTFKAKKEVTVTCNV